MIFIFTVYFKILGLALNFVGALILIVGTIKSNKQINTEATSIPVLKTKTLKRFLLKSRTISIIGLVIISVGFLFQLISIFSELYI